MEGTAKWSDKTADSTIEGRKFVSSLDVTGMVAVASSM